MKYTAYLIDDVEHDGYCFTDGCGKISLGLAKMVARSIGISVVTAVNIVYSTLVMFTDLSVLGGHTLRFSSACCRM